MQKAHGHRFLHIVEAQSAGKIHRHALAIPAHFRRQRWPGHLPKAIVEPP